MAVKKQTFLKGILFVMLSQFIIKILGFVYRIVLTNFKEFGDVGNSYYGSGYTVYTLILAVATMGIPNTISKLVSEKIAIGDRRAAHKIFRVALGLFSFTAIIFSLMLFFGSSFIAEKLLSNPGVKYTLMALSPAIIFVALSAVLRGYFIGMQNMVEYSKAQIIEQVVNSVCSVIFVVMLFGSTPEIMAAGSTLATTVAASTTFVYLYMYYAKNKKDIWEEIKKSEKFAIEPTKKVIETLIICVIPIAFGSIISSLSGLIDTVTVIDGFQKFKYTLVEANQKFGIYTGKADVLVTVPLSLNVAFSIALVPFISGAVKKGRRDEAIEKIKFSLKISSLIAFPCMAGLFFFAPEIFALLFPNSPDGAYLLSIQSLMLVFAVLAQTAYGAVQGLGKLYVPGICLLLGAIVKYVVNVVFIPIYGDVVPAISTVLFNFVAFVSVFIVLYKTIKQKPDIKELFLKPIGITVLMVVVLLASEKVLLLVGLNAKITYIVSIVFAVISYLFFVLKFRILSESELKQLPLGDKIAKIACKPKKK